VQQCERGSFNEDMKREDLNFYLQKVPAQEIFQLCEKINNEARVDIIQKPTRQTLLLPVKDPINKGSFFSGEVLVTSTIVQVNSENGWAMVLDENNELSRAVAILDGAFAAGILQEPILRLAEKGKNIIRDEEEKINRKVEATRVSFDLM
jgi:alpha-D-ribose 1-methylphosphonate 5-triphosphate synthase subunit PhnG